MKELIDKQIADQISQLASQVDKASVFDANTQRPNEVIVVDLDLSVGVSETDPKILKFPFKSVYVVEATDTQATINLKPITRDSLQGSIPFRDKDSWKLERQITDCFIHWEPQAGKRMKLIFFVSSNFESGSFVTVIQGGVSVVEGTSSTIESIVLTGGTLVTKIADQNSARKVLRVKNLSDQNLVVSSSALLTNDTGWEVLSGEIFEWKNTSELYCLRESASDAEIKLWEQN